jgi:hypothetical protein
MARRGSVGDAEANALQATAAQRAEQLDPERLRLDPAQVEADHLAPHLGRPADRAALERVLS